MREVDLADDLVAQEVYREEYALREVEKRVDMYLQAQAWSRMYPGERAFRDTVGYMGGVNAREGVLTGYSGREEEEKEVVRRCIVNVAQDWGVLDVGIVVPGELWVP